MTDDVLDILLRHAFLDALREDAAEVKTRVAYTPSVQHQREMRRMLADPLGWRRSRLQARHKGRKVFMRVAAVLLALLIGAGIWLSVDEEAQAALERWIWYELNAKKNYGFLYDDSDLQRVPHYYIGWVPEGFFLS